MKIIVNGEEKDVAATTVTGLLSELKIRSPEQVAIELNGDILDRNAYEQTAVKEGDQLEFIYFMGGGHDAY